MIANELENEISLLKKKLNDIRLGFEKYFCGNEKRPPSKEKDSLKKSLQQLKQHHVTNAAIKFQIQSLCASFNTLESHWEKTCRFIEEGKYRRDQFRSKKQSEQENSTRSSSQIPKQFETPQSNFDTLNVEQIYQQYSNSLKQYGQAKIPSKEAFSSTLMAKYQTLRQKYSQDQIEFQIDLKEGKPTLKAIVKQKK